MEKELSVDTSTLEKALRRLKTKIAVSQRPENVKWWTLEQERRTNKRKQSQIERSKKKGI